MIVKCCCDNMAVVEMVNSFYSRDKRHDVFIALSVFYLPVPPFSGQSSTFVRKDKYCCKYLVS